MSDQNHWEQVYTTKAESAVSWFQQKPQLSLDLIAAADVAPAQAVIDIGGGASRLVDELLAQGFSNLSVLDISAAALHTSQQRLAEKSARIDWYIGDITNVSLPKHYFSLWHDRAVFHFLTDTNARAAYKKNLLSALTPDGKVVIATFAEDGPTKCSNLPVMRYSTEQLYAEFSSDFNLLETRQELHHTPFNTTQHFIYCLLQRKT